MISRDQLHAVLADVVEPADEGRDEGGAGLGRQQRLRGREAQGDVDHRAFASDSALQVFQAVRRQRHLDGDVLGDLGELPAFFEHRLVVGRGGLGADRARDDGADLL